MQHFYDICTATVYMPRRHNIKYIKFLNFILTDTNLIFVLSYSDKYRHILLLGIPFNEF